MLNYALKRHDQLLNHSQFSTVTQTHSQVLQEQRWKHYFKIQVCITNLPLVLQSF